MDPASIVSALSSLKAARDVSKALLDLKVETDVQLRVIELQRLILSAQEETLNVQERIRTLEAELAKVDRWETKRQRYILGELGEGKFAYRLREQEVGGEPVHWICPNCYEDRRRSILQVVNYTTYKSYDCQRCGIGIEVGSGNSSTVRAYLI